MSDFDKWFALSEINPEIYTIKELMAEAWQASQKKWQNLGIDEIRKAAHKYTGDQDKRVFIAGVLWGESRLKELNHE